MVPDRHAFPEKISNFDYSLGTEVNKLAGQADALLVIRANDHISDRGPQGVAGDRRDSRRPGRSRDGAVGGATLASTALVDARSGSLLWYNLVFSSGGYDLRDSTSAHELVKALLVDFPVK